MTMREQLVQLLSWTLDPQLTKEATCSLDIMKSRKGFLRELIEISEDASISFSIKFSAIVYLKNSIEQKVKNLQEMYFLDIGDFEKLKYSLLEVLIRLIGKSEIKLLQTLKQIIFLLVKYEYKVGKWESLITILGMYIDDCPNEQAVKASLLVTKILFKILGKSLTQELKLNNLANKLILPLVNLASKMFSSLSNFACQQLIQVFKIFTEAIEFHLPEILQNNIHIFMVLVKNVLDFKLNHQPMLTNDNNDLQRELSILKMKKQAIKFLQKMYQRHSTSNLLSLKNFVKQFNQKYTKSFFQTIVGIIMSKTSYISEGDLKRRDMRKKIQKVNYELGNHTLGIFSFIASNRQSGKFIEDELEKYQIKIVYLSIEKFLQYRWHKLDNQIMLAQKNSPHQILQGNSLHQMQPNTSYQILEHSPPINQLKMIKLFSNYTDFVETINEQRLSLRLFLSTIMGNKSTPNPQKQIQQILQLLVKCIIDGSFRQKELALYLLASLEKEIELLSQQQGMLAHLNQKITIILKTYVFPLLTSAPQYNATNQLSENLYQTMVKLRGYSVYAAFQYLDLGMQHSIQLCEQIYRQLSSPTHNQLQQFLKIQGIETFNMILSQHQELVPLLSGHVRSILRIYTQLLEEEFEVMRFYDEILSLFSPYIGEIIYELVDLLSSTYFGLNNNKTAKLNCLTVNNYHHNQNENTEEDEEEEFITCEENDDGESNSNDTMYDDKNEKYDSVGTQCLASIKKLLYKQNVSFNEQLMTVSEKQKVRIIADRVLLAAVHGLSSRDEWFKRQSLCIINLLMYKGFVSNYYSSFFPLFLYPMLMSKNKDSTGNANLFRQRAKEYLQCQLSYEISNSEQIKLPSRQHYQYHEHYGSLQIKSQQTGDWSMEKLFEWVYKKMLRIYLNQQQECLGVLQLSDCVGILKNTVKYFNKQLYTMVCPLSGQTYIQLIIDTAAEVLQRGLEQGTYKCAEMIGMLAVFEAMLENRVFYYGFSIDSQSIDLYLKQVISHTLRWNQHLHSFNSSKQQQYCQNSAYYQSNDERQYYNEQYYNEDGKYYNENATKFQQQQLEFSMLQVILLVAYYYPQELLIFIENQTRMSTQNNNYGNQNIHDRSQDQFMIQFLNQHLIQKILPVLKTFSCLSSPQIQSQPCLPPLLCIILKSLSIIADALVTKTTLSNTQANQNMLSIIPQSNISNTISQSRRKLFLRIFLIISRLSIQIVFISLKQGLSNIIGQQLTKEQLSSIEQTFNSINKYRLKSTHLNHHCNQEEYKQENIMLTQMFSSLNLNYSSIYDHINQNQKSAETNHPNYQSNSDSSKQQFQQRHQRHINFTKQVPTHLPIEELFQNDSDSNSFSSAGNPFQKFDEEYLLAYDSFTLQPLSEKNRKVKLLNIMKDILEIHTNKNILYLKEIFELSCLQMH